MLKLHWEDLFLVKKGKAKITTIDHLVLRAVF